MVLPTPDDRLAEWSAQAMSGPGSWMGLDVPAPTADCITRRSMALVAHYVGGVDGTFDTEALREQPSGVSSEHQHASERGLSQ
jgi:hypothetical protein